MPQRQVDFEWSAQKAASNRKKNHVSFEEAETVFDDAHAYTQKDELHSDEESREVIIGYSERNRLLIVSFVQRGQDHIRIVSARTVTLREREIYEEAEQSR